MYTVYRELVRTYNLELVPYIGIQDTLLTRSGTAGGCTTLRSLTIFCTGANWVDYICRGCAGPNIKLTDKLGGREDKRGMAGAIELRLIPDENEI